MIHYAAIYILTVFNSGLIRITNIITMILDKKIISGLALIALVLFFFIPSAHADVVYQKPKEFVAASFQGEIPKVRVLWLTKEIKKTSVEILGHPYRTLRIRYWGNDQQTVWVLEEIGKELPITAGFVISKKGEMLKTRILIFRESRGGEIHYPFFTSQFANVQLTENLELNKHINGITGATLSVRAIKKLAKLALFLHQQTPFSK